jgi:hypothetical protein
MITNIDTFIVAKEVATDCCMTFLTSLLDSNVGDDKSDATASAIFE